MGKSLIKSNIKTNNMKNNINFWWALTGILGFAGVILLFTNDSAYAGAHGLEATYVVTGIALVLASIFCLIKAFGLSKPTNED